MSVDEIEAVAGSLGLAVPLELLPGGVLTTVAASGPPGAGAVLRAHPDNDGGVAHRFAFCRELHALGVPMAAPRTFVRAGSSLVTVWEYLDASGPVDWESLGAAFSVLHHCPARPRVPLVWAGRPEGVLADAAAALGSGAMSAADVCLLVDVWREGVAAVDGPDVVVHGDAWPKNVLFTARGALLVDWDTVCVAPAVVDLARLVRASEHWNPKVLGPWGAPDLGAFAVGYGAPLPGREVSAAVVRAHSAALALFCAVRGLLPAWVRSTVARFTG